MRPLHPAMAAALVLNFACAGPVRADESPVAAATAAARQHVAQHERAILAGYVELLSMPNPGIDESAIRQNAAYIRSLMEQRGIATRLLENGGGAPAIYGELRLPKGEKRAGETVVLYIHYDGQPTFPENWASPPFEPTFRKGRLEDGAEIVGFEDLPTPAPRDWRLYARSASDDKAPIMGVLAALDALKAAGIPLSVNLKFFLEGEEELGSPHLKELLERNKKRLKSDFWLFLDGPTDQRGNPRVVLGVRGSVGLDITTYGPISGLHSGHYGNFAPNPIAALARLIASMRDDDGRVSIRGFYDHVMPPSAEERALIAAIPEADDDIMKSAGLARREHEGMRYEETILWPALNVQGFRAGDVEARARNIVEPKAIANIGFRLVPGQTLSRLHEIVESHITGQGYHIVRADPDLETRLKYPRIAKVVWEGGYEAVRTSPEDPYAARLIDIMREATAGSEGGEVLVYPSLGGSLPLAHITDTLGAPLALLPIANADNSQHAPNENIRLGYFFRGIEYYAAVLAALGEPK